MVVTRFGRVEFDPMGVPTAAGMGIGRKEAFAEHLDHADRVAPPQAETPRPAAAEPAAVAERPAPQVAADAVDDRPEAACETATSSAAAELAAAHAPISGEGPERRIQADEGAGPPLESPAQQPARRAAPAAAAAPECAHRAPAAVAAGPMGAGATFASLVTARSQADRIGGTVGVAATRAASARAAATGYRTLTQQSLQHVEQARDSVFKQILFKLGKGSSEMRILLDPPELGELDLHLAVRDDATLRLSIGAERADLRDLLQSGLGELQQRLAAIGLEVAHAEVHARQQGDGRRSDAGTSPGRDADGDADDPAPEQAARPLAGSGWYSTQGLDFWV